MRTIFLDRDGVINTDFGYVNKWSDFKLIKGTLEALQLLTKHNFNIIILTNQAGIAKGFYTENDFKKLTNKFHIFCMQNDIKILDTLFCPHHKDGIVKEYAKDCDNRKPKSGMFFRASALHKVELTKAIMVGDNITDIIGSTNAGINNNFIVNSDYKNFKFNNKINFKIKENLFEVVKEILN